MNTCAKEFKTLDDFSNYIPNCLVCGKKLNIRIEVYCSAKDSKLGYYKLLKMNRDNNILSSYNKKIKLVIDPKTNLIIEGRDIIGNSGFSALQKPYYYLKCFSKCRTCNFTIMSIVSDLIEKIENPKYFPTLILKSKDITYTLNNKKVFITNHYYDYDKEMRTRFLYDNKSIKSYIDIPLENFINLKQLNKRIKTILTFQ